MPPAGWHPLWLSHSCTQAWGPRNQAQWSLDLPSMLGGDGTPSLSAHHREQRALEPPLGTRPWHQALMPLPCALLSPGPWLLGEGVYEGAPFSCQHPVSHCHCLN